ncbi:MAG: biotin carboxylase N-terminal domain-containing protein [Kofleriaceae bacterium]
MFKKVLVANRGEIACRVLRTLRRLGIGSVAVYHFVDRDAPHVRMADEAIELVGPTPVAAYLDGAQILAKGRGVDAIHPGYGFLSENAAFADACAAAGVTFIGPSAEAMRLLGDKIRSRELAAKAGARISREMSIDEATEFPLLIKASAGGGGKGMKVVRSRDELAAQVALATSEAERYFGDARVYVEKLIERPRHVEVQILGDGRGNVVAVGTRDCSIQRRYQKIIEEGPAVGIPDGLVDDALKIAAAAKYGNAGTVEFIVAPDGAYQFLEVNTRLQVEHPVTEATSGLELVEEQLKLAAGGALPSVGLPRGHAIECRICAEEPEHDFRPATGRIGVLRLPEKARVDSGVIEGQDVTAAFDSLLMKVIVHEQTRGRALSAMARALKELTILGVATNVDFLTRVITSEPMFEGALHTGFLTEHAFPAPATPPAAYAAALLADSDFRRSAFEVPTFYASLGGFRN